MMKYAWDAYKEMAWGEDELRPISHQGTPTLGSQSIALTMIDALDTLLIMEMDEEFIKARDFILNQVSFDKDTNVSMFEANIRVVGGLLSAFALCGDTRLLEKAFDMANRFLINFRTVFPMNDVNLMDHLRYQNSTEVSDQRGRPVALAQIGTFSLEFGYLSYVLKNPIFKEKAVAIIEELSKMQTSLPGLYPSTIYSGETIQPDSSYSLGGQADSFYEYLLKFWIMTGGKDQLHYDMYKNALKGIKRHLIKHIKGRAFLINRKGNQPFNEQEHLACFAPGMLGLGAHLENDSSLLELAEELTESCYLQYHRQKTGIGCEKMNVNTFKPIPNQEYWVMRPEVIESIFIMWRLTHNPKYRRWGLEIAQNIEKHAKVKSGGYAGIGNVNKFPLAVNDRQESFFLAETLKYLYLLFVPDTVIPLDKYVFNTEAHPLPIIRDWDL